MHKFISNMACALPGIAALLAAPAALATDTSFSGFGTIGYARSNQPYNYQRFIDNSGTFQRDTVFGAQLDANFNPEWAATVQAKLAPALNSDSRWQPVLSWAFLSYRPTNDLLVRAGKLRFPFYLRSESMDVGTTYAAARMPNELYSVSPTMDFTGASFVQTWTVGNSELDLDGYWGKSEVPWRTYTRDTATPFWLPLEINAEGLLLTLHQNENTFRAGYHTADITRTDGKLFYVSLSPNVMPPPSGMSGTYYTPPGSSGQTSKITTPAFSFAADVDLGGGFRAMGEYVRRTVKKVEIGPDTAGYYLSLLKEVNHWTPYITYAKIISKNLTAYQAVNNARVTSLTPGTAIPAADINAKQRAAADGMTMYDQYSWAIGTSYAIDPKNIIKAEWLIVHTGAVSSFVDAPAGEESGKRRINVYSLSYNFVF